MWITYTGGRFWAAWGAGRESRSARMSEDGSPPGPRQVVWVSSANGSTWRPPAPINRAGESPGSTTPIVANGGRLYVVYHVLAGRKLVLRVGEIA